MHKKIVAIVFISIIIILCNINMTWILSGYRLFKSSSGFLLDFSHLNKSFGSTLPIKDRNRDALDENKNFKLLF